MNTQKQLLVLLAITFASCVANPDRMTFGATDTNQNRKVETQKPNDDQHRPSENNVRTTVSIEQGRVRVMRGGKTLCSLVPAMTVVERYELVNNTQQIIIKSRGNHGPATVELFNLSDGTLADQVLAYAINNSQPAWARGWEE